MENDSQLLHAAASPDAAKHLKTFPDAIHHVPEMAATAEKIPRLFQSGQQ